MREDDDLPDWYPHVPSYILISRETGAEIDSLEQILRYWFYAWETNLSLPLVNPRCRHKRETAVRRSLLSYPAKNNPAYTPPKWNTTPTTAEMPMNTMGCQSFTFFTQLVNTSSTAANASPCQFRREPPAA